MKTNLATLVASLTFLLTATAACSAPPAPSANETATAAQTEDTPSVLESAPSEPYVLLEETAAGYTLTTLNTGAETQATALDLSAVGDAASMVSSLSEPGTLAARGTMRAGGTFVVTDLYRALPSTNATPPAAVYRAHVRAHGADGATVVNVGRIRLFHALDLTEAAGRFVDQTWLAARVLDGAALVAGSITSGVLHASAVLVRVPEVVACTPAVEACDDGTVATYARDANRCLVPAGCVHREMCPMYIAACQPGYMRTTWPGPRGCPASACDPEFDPAP